MDAPTSDDRARKMEMRQEAAAVAAASAAATIDEGNASTTASDAASIMLSLAMGPFNAGYKASTDGSLSAVPRAGTPVTPKARRKGKGRAANLGPSFGMRKGRGSTSASPVNVVVAATAVSPGSAVGSAASVGASALRSLAPRPPTFPAGLTPQLRGSATNAVATSGEDMVNGVTGTASSSAAVPPLAARGASVAGFVVRSSPKSKAAAEPRFSARATGAITTASPVVGGIRRRTHRIPAARLARQLQAAGATAAAMRLHVAGDSIDGRLTCSPSTACSPATEASLFSSPASPSPALAAEPTEPADRAVPVASPVAGAPNAATVDMNVESRGDGATRDGGGVVEECDGTEVVDGGDATEVVGGGEATGVVSASEATGANLDGSSFFGHAARGGAASGAILATLSEPSPAPTSSAPGCVVGATSANPTPALTHAEPPAATTSASPTPLSPTRPLTWRSTRQIPSPTIEYPLSTTPIPTVASASADAGVGQLNSKAAKVLQNAVTVSTANMRVDLAALCARTNDTAARMQQLATKVDTCANLTQHTLVAVRKIEAAVKLAMEDVVKKGACPPKESEEVQAQRAETLLEDVKKAYRDGLVNQFATAVETVAVFANCDDNWDMVVAAADSCMKQGTAKAEEWLNSFIRRTSRRNSSIFVNVRISMLILRVKPHLHQTWTDLIVSTFFSALGLDAKNLEETVAKGLLLNNAYYMTDRGRDACLDALAAIFRVVGASNRVTDPANPTDGRSIRATLGHFAFVSTKVRNVLELAAGERATSRAGGVGDGHFPMWVAEVRRMDSVFPSDGALERGLQLIDGAALERGLPQY